MANSNTVLNDYAELELNVFKNKNDAAMTVCFISLFL